MKQRRTLLETIDADPLFRELYATVSAQASEDPSHDLGQVLRVALWTLRLLEPGADPREALAAALLHDIVDLPKSSPQRAKASELSAQRARELLAG